MQVTRRNLKNFLKLQLENTPTKDTSLSKYSESYCFGKSSSEALLKKYQSFFKNTPQNGTPLSKYSEEDLKHSHKEEFEIFLKNFEKLLENTHPNGHSLSKYSEGYYSKPSRGGLAKWNAFTNCEKSRRACLHKRHPLVQV